MAAEKFERIEVVQKRQADALSALHALAALSGATLPKAQEQLQLEEFKEKTLLSAQVHRDLQQQVSGSQSKQHMLN
jgi:hypothetical protein